LVTAPVIALAAGVPFSFSPGKVISSSEMNMNFAAVTARLDALEASLQKRTVTTAVVANVAGPLPLTHTFTTAGGDVMLIVSGSGYGKDDSQALTLSVQVDGKQSGSLTVFANKCCVHLAFPAGAIPLTSLVAGSHVVTIASGNAETLGDDIDYFNVTAVETFH
jgi:hypothetical protein